MVYDLLISTVQCSRQYPPKSNEQQEKLFNLNDIFFWVCSKEDASSHFLVFLASSRRCILLLSLGKSDPLVLSISRNYGRTSSILWKKKKQYYFRFCLRIHCKHSSNHFKLSSFAWKKWLKVINESSLRTFDDKFIGKCEYGNCYHFCF